MNEVIEAGEAGTAAPRDASAWPLRPVLLAMLGLAAGLLAHLILGNGWSYRQSPSALQTAGVTAVTLSAALIGFTLERRLWWASILFSIVAAMIAALIVYGNGSPGGWSASEGWRTASLLLAVAIAAPLFQAARDEGALRTPYESVHDHAWTNVVLWFACWLFVGIVFLLAWLLAMLFHLIKIDTLRHLLDEYWFCRALMGLAFGTALGVLRENDGVVRLLQRVVATVLAVLAPVLAAGLAIFVLALPFTGLNALWDATSASTPILLSCEMGALILINAVIGNSAEQERRFPLLRYAAMLLAAVMLPLAVLAAVATGLRIGQYGFTPERLWAIVFVGIACLWGLAYLASLVLGRMAWTARVRPANLALAFLVCGVALVLATPIVSFNAISTRDQVARLESGEVSADEFDWRALAFDFGQPGRNALVQLKKSANAAIRDKASETVKAENRYSVPQYDERAERREMVMKAVRLLPAGTAFPDGLRDLIVRNFQCYRPTREGESVKQVCTLAIVSGGNEALLFRNDCFERAIPAMAPSRGAGSAPQNVAPIVADARAPNCDFDKHYVLKGRDWVDARTVQGDVSSAENVARAEAYKAGRIEIRPVQGRQVFVGGVPVGAPFE